MQAKPCYLSLLQAHLRSPLPCLFPPFPRRGPVSNQTVKESQKSCIWGLAASKTMASTPGQGAINPQTLLTMEQRLSPTSPHVAQSGPCSLLTPRPHSSPCLGRSRVSSGNGQGRGRDHAPRRSRERELCPLLPRGPEYQWAVFPCCGQGIWSWVPQQAGQPKGGWRRAGASHQGRALRQEVKGLRGGFQTSEGTGLARPQPHALRAHTEDTGEAEQPRPLRGPINPSTHPSSSPSQAASGQPYPGICVENR